MTARFLLDTSTVSEPMKKHPDAAVVRQLERRGQDCAIASPIWHELQYGCERLPEGKKRSALAEYLKDVVHASFPVLPYDEVAAAWHARERARLDGLGRPAPFVDGQIAAIAQRAGLILVTMNVRDFQRFEGLEVESWSSRRAGRA